MRYWMKLKLLLLLIFCTAGSVSHYGQCDTNTNTSVIDTFCTGTRYFFGDTLIRTAGIYTQTFQDLDDCDSLVTLDLRETPNVTFFIDIDTLAPQCLGDSLGGFVVNVENAVEPIDYALFEGSFSFNQIQLPLENPQRSNVFSDLEFGNYTVVIIDRFGCGGLARLNLSLQPIKGPTIKDTLCLGSVFPIGRQRVTEEGMYLDTLTGFMGCDSVVTIDLAVLDFDNEINFELSAIPAGCSQQINGTIELLNVVVDAPPYRSYIDGTPFENIVEGLEPDMYEITVEDRFLCSHSQFVQIEEASEMFTIQANKPDPVSLGEQVSISIDANTDIDTIVWNRIPTQDCVACSSFSFTPLESFDYVLTATNNEGCVAQDTLSIVVVEGDSYFIPDVMRPNSFVEGNNVFTVFGNENVVQSISALSIFDKYGNKVFNSPAVAVNDFAAGWNGTLNGSFVEQGVYSYVVTIQLINGKTEIVGGTFLVMY